MSSPCLLYTSGNDALYDEIIAFAREHDLLIVHDNAYSDIVFDGPRGGTFLAHPGALEVGVEFFSLSKSFNVTGAVSYTHLDVYKRQVLGRAAAPVTAAVAVRCAAARVQSSDFARLAAVAHVQ